ncbi:hypothetical protein BJF82_04915 [Kytococcus sp. CUA-901]|nr:hypothetical protein BJF82_04915 [Kytococcus sp. CUA-901]
MAHAQGVDMELVHRATAMASVSWDSLPHNGAIITLLRDTGLTHRESYKDIFVPTVLVPLIGVAAVIALGLGVGAF